MSLTTAPATPTSRRERGVRASYDPLLLTLATGDEEARQKAENALRGLYGATMRAAAEAVVEPEHVPLVLALSWAHAATWGLAYVASLGTVGGWLRVITKRTGLGVFGDQWLRAMREGQHAERPTRRGGLTEDDRRAVSLAVIHGWDVDEIAEREGVARDEVRRRIRRGTALILRVC